MKLRGLVAVAVGVLVAVVVMRDIGGEAPLSPTRPPPRPARPVRSGSAPLPAITRNVFEYAARAAPEPTSRPAAPLTTPSLPPVVVEPVTPVVRLLGLVRRGGVIKAALQIQGESVVVGPGELAGDYRVVGIDEDGVRLRARDGTTITLPAGGPSGP